MIVHMRPVYLEYAYQFKGSGPVKEVCDLRNEIAELADLTRLDMTITADGDFIFIVSSKNDYTNQLKGLFEEYIDRVVYDAP